MVSGELVLPGSRSNESGLRLGGGLTIHPALAVKFTDLWLSDGPRALGSLPSVGQTFTGATWVYERHSGDQTMAVTAGAPQVTSDGIDVNPGGTKSPMEQAGNDYVASNAVVWTLALVVKMATQAQYHRCWVGASHESLCAEATHLEGSDLYFFDDSATPDAIDSGVHDTDWHLYTFVKLADGDCVFEVDGVTKGTMDGSAEECWPRFAPGNDDGTFKVRVCGAGTGDLRTDPNWDAFEAWAVAL